MLCVIAKIDIESREYLRNIQRIANSFGIPPRVLHGHVTLATFVSGDEAEIIRICKERLHQQKIFTIWYEKIEVLPVTSIIVASPQNKDALFDVHIEITTDLVDLLDIWTRNENWMPHTTLVHQKDVNLDVIAAEMRKKFAPFSACVERIEFSRVNADGYEIIDAIDLKNTD